MLGPHDRLPGKPRRILVAGVSGVGKTTLAARISVEAGVDYTEIDGLFHGPGWTPRPEFVGDILRLAATDEWVTEWQYSSARAILLQRADTLVWLDLPFRVTLARVIRRTVRRRVRREVLWNGNREPGLIHAICAPEGIIRWAVRTRRKYRILVADAASQRPDLVVVRLGATRDVDSWVSGALARSV